MATKYSILLNSINELKYKLLNEREKEKNSVLNSLKQVYEEFLKNLSVNNIIVKFKSGESSKVLVKNTILNDFAKIYSSDYKNSSKANVSIFLRKYNFQVLHNLNENYLLIENFDLYFLIHILFNQLINFIWDMKGFIQSIMLTLEDDKNTTLVFLTPLKLESLRIYDYDPSLSKLNLSFYKHLLSSYVNILYYLSQLTKSKTEPKSNKTKHHDVVVKTCTSNKVTVYKPRCKKYQMFDDDIKAKAISIASAVGNKLASDLLKVPLKSLKRWIRVGPARKPGGGRKAMDPVLDGKILEWYNKLTSEGIAITSNMIRSQALKFTTMSAFKASKGWLEKVKRKYNLKLH